MHGTNCGRVLWRLPTSIRFPSSSLVEVDGTRKVYRVNDLRKYYTRIDYAHNDHLCVNVSQCKRGAVNTCAVVYEKDSDLGEIDVIEPSKNDSEDIRYNVDQFSSQKIPPDAVAHLSKEQVSQLWHRHRANLDQFSINVQCYSQNHAHSRIFGPPYRISRAI